MFTIFEKSGIHLMYAIWPHDLFSETGWAAQWDNNPYSQLIDIPNIHIYPAQGWPMKYPADTMRSAMHNYA